MNKYDLAKDLFASLGSPRGQVSVVFVPDIQHGDKLKVWIKTGYPQAKIPPMFHGVPVEVDEMPVFKATIH